MSEISLREAAQDVLNLVDYMLANGEWYNPRERAEKLRVALAQQQEPVAEVHAFHLRAADDNGHWCRQVLLYSGNSPHDQSTQGPRVKLYTSPVVQHDDPFQDLEQASKRCSEKLARMSDAAALAPALTQEQLSSLYEPERCSWCDDTGDVHSFDGEWRGTCVCPAGDDIRNKVTPIARPSDKKITDIGVKCGVISEGYHSEAHLEFVHSILDLLRPAPVAQPMPEFDEIDDETIDAACVAGGIYRVDLMRAYNVLRAHNIGTNP